MQGQYWNNWLIKRRVESSDSQLPASQIWGFAAFYLFYGLFLGFVQERQFEDVA